jgi:transposase
LYWWAVLDHRDLTRQRTNLVQDRARVVNQLQKVLEWANIKLTSVVTDIMGVSARAMLAAIVGGEVDQGVLADLAQGRLRAKQAELEQALVGYVREHHRFLLARHLIHIDFLEEEITHFDEEIETFLATQTPIESPAPASFESAGTEHESTPDAPLPSAIPTILPWAEAVELLDTAPGIGRTAAELILAEIGTDMRRFPTEGHLASWAKVCPGNRQSGGKQYSSRTGKGSRWLRPVLVQAAWAAIRVKDSRFAAVYRRLVVRLGKQKAIMAIAHRLLIAIYHMLMEHVPYREAGILPPSGPAKQKRVTRLQREIEQLGFTVTVQPTQSAVT